MTDTLLLFSESGQDRFQATGSTAPHLCLLEFKSSACSSFIIAFLTPPTVGYLCQPSSFFCLSSAIASPGRHGPWHRGTASGLHHGLKSGPSPGPNTAGKLFSMTIKLASCYWYAQYSPRLFSTFPSPKPG